MNDQKSMIGGPITPRCLSALPLDIEEILKHFENQKQEL